MKKFSLIFSALLSTLQLFSQTPSWHTLTNAHFVTSRHEDIFFLNAYTGWTFYSYLNKVTTYKTTDGGYTWDSLITPMPGNVFFRCIGFFNSQTGIAGTLTLNKPLYRTTDGGISWVLISYPPSVSNGICGISIVDSATAYAVGIYSGPAGIIKTTDAGMNWDSISTDTSLVRSLVDCYFWSQDSGIAVGGYRGYASVIITTNGGTSWQRAHLTNRIGEWCWKISFVSRMVGFVSIERSGFSYILKTTNGGFIWTEIPFRVYDQEGIGFLNELTGWVGGWTGPTYETTNGGTNWHQVPWGYYINRFRFINDTTAYAVGQTVYKFTTEPIGIQPISNEVPKMFFLHQNYPNPFNPKTKIKFEIKSTSLVRLIIYDAIGRKADELINENLKPGIYETAWDASDYSSGIYFYELRSGELRDAKKMVLVK